LDLDSAGSNMFEVSMEDFNRLEARVDQVEDMLRKDKKER